MAYVDCRLINYRYEPYGVPSAKFNAIEVHIQFNGSSFYQILALNCML